MQKINVIASSYTSRNNHYGVSLLQAEEKQLFLRDIAIAGEQPSYLVSDGKDTLYVANEIDDRCCISICTLTPEGLILKGQMNSRGQGACHLSYDRATGLLFASCYGSGHIVCFDTALQKEKCSFLPEDCEGSHAHGTVIAFDGEWLFSVDLGKDCIHAFRMEEIMEGSMKPVSTLTLKPSTGPRQILTDPKHSRLYCINELDSSVHVISFDKGSGKMSFLHAFAASKREKENYPGTAAITRDGRYLFVPNRGANTIALFEIGSDQPIMKYECDCLGIWPRYLCLTEDDTRLLVANQRSGNITMFSFREYEKEALTYLDSIAIGEANCVLTPFPMRKKEK